MIVIRLFFVTFDGYIVDPVEVLLVEICVICFMDFDENQAIGRRFVPTTLEKKGFQICILIIQRLSHVSQIYCRTNAYLLSFVCEYFICCLCGIPILVLLDWWFKIVNFWAEFKFTLGCLPLVFRSDHHVGNQKVTLKKLSMMMCI